jgi:glycosyltransferase involved in cell wall biosynthesis
MPVYNAQRYLAQAVASILAQTLRDFEFLIVDDGSTDRSLEMLQAYAIQDSRITLVSRPNTGYVRALNELLAMARGEFIARMDADDIALPDRFALQAAFLHNHPDHVCVGGAYDLIDHRGRLLTCLRLPETDGEIQALALVGHTPINHPSAMLRRQALLDIGGYDEDLCPSEDLDIWLKLGERGRLANLPDRVLQYRQHDQSVSEVYQQQQTAKRRECCERAWQRRGVVGQYRFEGSEHWRPTGDRASRHKFMLQYGWWAFNSGQGRTAALYGGKAILAQPWRRSGWTLLASALVKSPPPPLGSLAQPFEPNPLTGDDW